MIMQRLAYMFASLRWTLLVPQDGMCLFVVILKHKLFTGGSDFCWPRCIHDISDHFQHISMSKDYQFYDRVVFPTCEFSAVQTATHQCLASSASFTWQVMGRLRGSQQQILSIIRKHMEMEEWLGEPRGVILFNDSKIGRSDSLKLRHGKRYDLLETAIHVFFVGWDFCNLTRMAFVNLGVPYLVLARNNCNHFASDLCWALLRHGRSGQPWEPIFPT